MGLRYYLYFNKISYYLRIRLGYAVPILLRIAFYTVAERKLIRRIQRRQGPVSVGVWGLLQAFADRLKLIFKEVIFPVKIKFKLFLVRPIISFIFGFLRWVFINFDSRNTFTNFKFSLLRILRVNSVRIYGIIFRGWASSSRYPFLGRVRAATQIISYELVLTINVILVSIVRISFNLTDIICFQNYTGILRVPLLPLFISTYIVGLAETNRTPFDLPEREAELVAGYNLEYSSIPFRLFFLREYSNMLIISRILTRVFLGAWSYYIFKIIIVASSFIIIRALLPRFRYDQLLFLGWQVLLPCSLGYSFLIFFIII